MLDHLLLMLLSLGSLVLQRSQWLESSSSAVRTIKSVFRFDIPSQKLDRPAHPLAGRLPIALTKAARSIGARAVTIFHL